MPAAAVRRHQSKSFQYAKNRSFKRPLIVAVVVDLAFVPVPRGFLTEVEAPPSAGRKSLGLFTVMPVVVVVAAMRLMMT
jgi:hypothetical protein